MGSWSRYLTRPRDPSTLLPASANDGVWSDYAFDTVCGDYTVSSGGDVTNTARYVPGLWQKDLGSGDEASVHADQIGTTRALTDANGAAARRAIFTAFGEPVMEDGTFATRYGYAGAWGYEGDALCLGDDRQLWDDGNKLGFLHVGERLYDPATGRFLQRDPIGVAGGHNCYAYVESIPTSGVDPDGLQAFLPQSFPGCKPPSSPAPGGSIGGWNHVPGAPGRSYWERWGDEIGANATPILLASSLCASTRITKGIQIPGTPSTTSIWTKVPGLSLKTGMYLGRASIAALIVGAAHNVYVIGRAAYEAW